MPRSEHNREAYRALFGYVGAGLQVFALLMIAVSIPISPTWLPTFAGTLAAVTWMVAIGVGVGILGWSA
jgi:hypothetical protein